ncbi:ATP-NAD kinase, partial [candidate division MSBL1 archaeon SCGC-AAA259E19]
KDQEAIARWVVEQMEEGVLYILAPGTTTRAVAEEMGISEFTLLGVDLIRNGELLAEDVMERRILAEIEDDSAIIILSPIGKQGFILGRGNQQVSPKVVRKVGIDNIMILATPGKIAETPMLKVDTGDPDLDEEFKGYVRVIMGYKITRPVPVA